MSEAKAGQVPAGAAWAKANSVIRTTMSRSGPGSPASSAASTAGTRSLPQTPGSVPTAKASPPTVDSKMDKKLQNLMPPSVLQNEIDATTPQPRELKMNASLQEKLAPELLAAEVAPPQAKGPRRQPKTNEGGPSASSEPKLDPKLQKRLEQQRAKEASGGDGSESSSANVTPTRTVAETKLDPKLQERLDRQREKEATEKGGIGDVSSAAKIETKFEPVLARRMEKQLAKEEGKEQTLPSSLERTDKIQTKLDPKLQKRLEAQQQKLVTGQSSVKDDWAKDVRIACQADLEKRMQKQREKVVTGHSDVGNVGSAAGPTTRVNSELAAKFERRRLLDEEAERRAAGLDDQAGGGGKLRRFGRRLRQMFCGGRGKEPAR